MVEVQNLQLHRLFNALVVELELMMEITLVNQEDLELEQLTDLQEHKVLLEKELQEKVTTEDKDTD
jgi:hypothetical protein